MAEQHVRLKAPPKVWAVEYGGEVFKITNGHVIVPMHAHGALIGRLGFAWPDDAVIHFQDQAVRMLKVKR